MLSKIAFDDFRTAHSPAKEVPLHMIKNEDELKQISEADGLNFWIDGSSNSYGKPLNSPEIPTDYEDKRELWAIRNDDVVYAAEKGAFGKSLETRELKHSNLTGGAPAFCAGELLFLEANTIILNGRSGRYGPRTEAEMTAVAAAFRQSGYMTWSMGYDCETDQPFPFGSKEPEWVQP